MTTVELVSMHWSDPMPLEPRFYQLLQRIDQLHQQGHTISLIGFSAGASAAITALTQRPNHINKVVTICGKIQGDIPDSIKELNPCFAESLRLLDQTKPQLTPTSKQRLRTYFSPWDAVVPADQAVLDGVAQHSFKIPGHNLTCAYIILCQRRQIKHFLSHQPSTLSAQASA